MRVTRELDVRIPLGTVLVALGALLAGYGALAPRAPAAATGRVVLRAGLGVDLWWGVVMLGAGVLALVLALAAARRARTAAPTSSSGELP